MNRRNFLKGIASALIATRLLVPLKGAPEQEIQTRVDDILKDHEARFDNHGVYVCIGMDLAVGPVRTIHNIWLGDELIYSDEALQQQLVSSK